VQLSVTGNGERLRHVLLPAIVSRSLLASRGEAGPDAPVFRSRKGGAPHFRRAVNRMIKRAAERAGVNRRCRRTGCGMPTPAIPSGAVYWLRLIERTAISGAFP
jgi:integrase